MVKVRILVVATSILLQELEQWLDYTVQLVLHLSVISSLIFNIITQDESPQDDQGNVREIGYLQRIKHHKLPHL